MRLLPLIAPDPPRLSEMGDALARVEPSGTFGNHGPEARASEREATDRLFGAAGMPLPDAYGTGLAPGFLPWRAPGGEARFRGQANGP